MSEVERLRREVARGAGPDVVRRLLRMLEVEVAAPDRKWTDQWRHQTRLWSSVAWSTETSSNGMFACPVCMATSPGHLALWSLIGQQEDNVCPACVRLQAEAQTNHRHDERGIVWTFASFGSLETADFVAFNHRLLLLGFEPAKRTSWPFWGTAPSARSWWALEVEGDPAEIEPIRVPLKIQEVATEEIGSTILWPSPANNAKART